MLEAVIFDYAGVVGKADWHFSAVDRSGQTINHAEIVPILTSGYGTPGHPLCRWELGEFDFDGFRDVMTEHAPESSIEWSSLEFETGEVVLHKEMISTIHLLRRQGLKTALLSNTMHEFVYLNRAYIPLEALFDVTVFSCEAGLRKPDSAVFERMLDHLQVAAEQALFLDDNPVCIEGAHRVGLQTMLVVDPAEAARNLAQLQA